MPFLGMPVDLRVRGSFSGGGKGKPPVLKLEPARLVLRFRPAVFVRDEDDVTHDLIVEWPKESFEDNPEPIFAAFAPTLSVDAVQADAGGIPVLSTQYWQLESIGQDGDDELVALTFRADLLGKAMLTKQGKADAGKAKPRRDLHKALHAFRQRRLAEVEKQLAARTTADPRHARALAHVHAELGVSHDELARRLEARQQGFPPERVRERNLYRALLEQSEVQLHLNLDGTMRNRGTLFVNLVCEYRGAP